MSTWPSPDELQRKWREELKGALDRQRVPPPWRDRLIEELEDHLSDLKENTMSMNARIGPSAEERLGMPQELAAAAATEYRRLGFLARRPLLTYVVGPLLVVPVLFIAWLLASMTLVGGAAAAAATLFDLPSQEPFPGGELIALGTTLSFRFVPFALAAWLFCSLARRHSQDWRWTIVACAMIGIFAALLVATVQAATPSAQGMLTVGVALPPQGYLAPFQALAPLAIGALFLWRAKYRAGGYALAAGEAG